MEDGQEAERDLLSCNTREAKEAATQTAATKHRPIHCQINHQQKG